MTTILQYSARGSTTFLKKYFQKQLQNSLKITIFAA